MSDIFAKLNDLNLSLQGKNCDIFTSNDKIESFIKKINIWKSRVEKNSFEMFSGVDNFVIEKNHCKTFIAKIIVDHLKALVPYTFYIKCWFQKGYLDSKAVLDWLE